MKKAFFVLYVIVAANACAQNAVLKEGSIFPDYTIRHIINAPVKQLNPLNYSDKILILNFWGTWCSPCLPEMDSLAALKKLNPATIEVIGISNETTGRLQNYLKRKPSGLWLASDTATFLYRLFDFNSVGQCAVIDKNHRIVAVTLTDSVNQAFINRVVRGLPVKSYAETGKTNVTANTDVFGADTTTLFSMLLKPYLTGATSMGKGYNNTPFEGRRKSFINVCPEILYKSATGIEAQGQVIFENTTEKETCNYKDTNALYCYDIVVGPASKDSLAALMLKHLNMVLPIKGRLEKKVIPVYVLHRRGGDSLHIAVSSATKAEYSFSGTGFEGTGIAFKVFADYLANDLDLPVYDDTGLNGRYDIKTENVLRTVKDVLEAAGKLGLVFEKGEKEMDVLILYK